MGRPPRGSWPSPRSFFVIPPPLPVSCNFRQSGGGYETSGRCRRPAIPRSYAVVCGQMLGLNKWRGQSVGAPHYSDSILPVHSAGAERLLVMMFLSVADRSLRRHRKELRSNMRNDRMSSRELLHVVRLLNPKNLAWRAVDNVPAAHGRKKTMSGVPD